MLRSLLAHHTAGCGGVESIQLLCLRCAASRTGFSATPPQPTSISTHQPQPSSLDPAARHPPTYPQRATWSATAVCAWSRPMPPGGPTSSTCTPRSSRASSLSSWRACWRSAAWSRCVCAQGRGGGAVGGQGDERRPYARSFVACWACVSRSTLLSCVGGVLLQSEHPAPHTPGRSCTTAARTARRCSTSTASGCRACGTPRWGTTRRAAVCALNIANVPDGSGSAAWGGQHAKPWSKYACFMGAARSAAALAKLLLTCLGVR